MRVGNASGFYGDRFSALREMLTGGELDVLTGDYLAELTLLILGRDRLKDPARGYAATFLRQLEDGLGLARERGVRLVANAGGLNPAGLADAVRELSARVGVPARVAHVEGDDLSGRPGLSGHPGGWGEGALTANAYLGGAGIAECLRAGADVVVTGRVADASLVSGAATARFGWAPDDWDALAGAVVAGHVLECGAQATGGNYAFFAEEGIDVRHPGFPLAEIRRDGSCVVTKHPGTGGAVTVGTVTAQLLYETAGARYPGPDVTARLDTVRLTPDGPDRVRIDGVRGEPRPDTLKVGVTRLAGYRNEVTFVLTGLDVPGKAALVREQLEAALASGPAPRPAGVSWTLARTDRPDAAVQEEASALLRLVVRDADPAVVGRAVSGAAVELALASYPGFQLAAPPGRGEPYGVFASRAVPREAVTQLAVHPDGTRVAVDTATLSGPRAEPPVPPSPAQAPPAQAPPAQTPPPRPGGAAVRRVPLGRVLGARSGDKGGSANIGVWARDGDAGVWSWMERELTAERVRELLPEAAGLAVARHALPNLRALNFTLDGVLGEGAASRARFDPQGKGLGEWLRARHMDIPEELLIWSA
nr:acyclic terpene utilization AtuA family protein [Streptomyces boncukensis]